MSHRWVGLNFGMISRLTTSHPASANTLETLPVPLKSSRIRILSYPTVLFLELGGSWGAIL